MTSKVACFFTTCIENSNGLERFADRYLLAPLHYLLTQKYDADRIERYQIRANVVEPRYDPILAPDWKALQILKIFCAVMGVVLLIVPAILLKLIGQCFQSSIALHQALAKYREGEVDRTKLMVTLNKKVFSADAILPCVAKYLFLREINILSAVCKIWQTPMEQSPFWNSVARRFPEYQYREQRDVEPRKWMRDALAEMRSRFNNISSSISSLGGSEWALSLPIRKIIFRDNPFFRSNAHEVYFCNLGGHPKNPSLLLPVFRVRWSLPGGEQMGSGIVIRTVKILRNEITMTSKDQQSDVVPNRKMLGSLFLDLSYNQRTSARSSFWSMPDSYTGEVSFQKNRKAQEWLQQLLSGNFCGCMPGSTEYQETPTSAPAYQLFGESHIADLRGQSILTASGDDHYFKEALATLKNSIISDIQIS